MGSTHWAGGRAAAPRGDPWVGAEPQSPLPASPPSLGKKGQTSALAGDVKAPRRPGSAPSHTPSSPDAAQCTWQPGAPPTEVSGPKLERRRA